MITYQSIVKASELNRTPGKVLRRAAVEKRHVIVESDGYPVVAMIAYPEYEKLMRAQAARELGALLDETDQYAVPFSDEEVEADVLKEIQRVRRSKRKKK